MELERLSVSLRPRNHWEAIDLGIRLALKHARPLYASWFSVTLPVSALVFLIVGAFFSSKALAFAIVWWLKPAFDRVALHVISHAVFSDTPSVRETLRALPKILRSSRLIWGLTFGRFSPQRSLLLPVDALEGLRGREARQRKQLISRRVSSAAIWQTVAWIHLESLFWISIWALIALMIPKELLPDFNIRELDQLSDLTSWVSCVSLCLVSQLLEPLYVAGGFMLYIKRRTDLEAWDIELQFRHLTRRAVASTLASLIGGLLVAGVIMCSALAPAPAQASERENAVAQAPQTLKQVLKQPEFGKDEVDYVPRWRDNWKRPDTHFDWLPSAPEWLKHLFAGLGEMIVALFGLIGSLGRIVAWCLIAAAAIGLIYLISRYRLKRMAPKRKPLAELAGFDIRPQSLPTDIPGTALNLLHQGDPRAALSLLFRGSLSRLAHDDQVPFGRGDTEGDCLERVHQNVPARAGFFARLLGCWLKLAYAHQTVPAPEIEKLCQDWGREFSPRSAHA